MMAVEYIRRLLKNRRGDEISKKQTGIGKEEVPKL